jgi:iron complex outermembrane receptor protein
MMIVRRVLGLAMIASAPGIASSQDSASTTLVPMIITATRGAGISQLDAPFAVTVIRPDSIRPGQRHVALDESLLLVPGLAAASRNNPAQDPRLSIRGFGARSAFGVRGVRVLRDGMPLTLPDGQTPIDYISLESVGRVDVIRGAASALYGNASGGVVDLRSAPPPTMRVGGELRQTFGSDDMVRTSLAAGGTSGPIRYLGDIAHYRTDGFRIHGRQRATSGFGRASITLGGAEYAMQLLGLDQPLAENPGAVTRAELETNPRIADALSVRRNARKVVHQTQLGLSSARETKAGEASLLVFGGRRTLYNPLTFGIVDIGRTTSGASTRLGRFVGSGQRITIGGDYQRQNDARRNFVTCADTVAVAIPTASCPRVGHERGALTLDQREIVSSIGVFANGEVSLGARWRLTVGARMDAIKFEVRDRFITATNPDDSGDRTLRALTPIIGLVARMGATSSAYANLSSAFETPTATELGNHPDGSAGINQALDPQRSRTIEIGYRELGRRALAYDVALFSTHVRDELVSYEIPASNGRRYFRNAGRTTRRGAEIGVTATVGPAALRAAYTWSDFGFDRFVTDSAVYDGNTIPGLPRHRLQASGLLGDAQRFFVVESEATASAFADDANTVRAPGSAVVHARAGLAGLPAGLSITAGIQNVFDRRYSPSLIVNAARGKYFEPAPERSFYLVAGISRR